MSDPHEPAPEGAGDLQFDQAEFAAATPAEPVCAACKHGLDGVYYEVNGALVCPPCRDAIVSGRTQGPGIVRFVRAGVYGAGAAVAGFLIYFGVMKLANIEIGLISILVGYMVGASVRAGARHRGGAVYQLLAIFLTYTAIAASYSATVLPQFFADFKQKEAAKAAAGATDPAKKAEPAGAAKPGPAVAAAPAPAKREDAVPLSAATVIIALVTLIVFTYEIPILAGIESPIGLFIIAFALWEAWKLNRRVPITFRGPFTLGGSDGDDDEGGEEPDPRGAAAHA